MRICYKCTHEIINESSSSNDWITVTIAILAVIVTVLVVFIGKSIEIKINKFNKLCLEPLELQFSLLETIILKDRSELISGYLPAISEIATDFTLIIVQIKIIYPKLNIDELQDLFHEFTDKAYENKSEMLYSIFGDFVGTKVKILHKIHTYALSKELWSLKK